MAKSSHRLALAAGADVWLTAEEERISGAHELVALAARPAANAGAAGRRRPGAGGGL